MPSISSKITLSSAASSSGLAIADIDLIKGAFYTVAEYNMLAQIPTDRLSDGQIIWVEDAAATYQLTITPANPPITFVDTYSWNEFSGFAGGGGAGTGDITAVIAGSGLVGGAFSGNATLNIGQGNGISVLPDSINLDTGSAHFISGVIDLNVFNKTGSYYSTTNQLQVTGSLTLRKDSSGDALSIYSGSIKTFGISEQGVLTLTTQSIAPTAINGGLYLDENYNLYIGQE
jgi:hypothetical protein